MRTREPVKHPREGQREKILDQGGIVVESWEVESKRVTHKGHNTEDSDNTARASGPTAEPLEVIPAIRSHRLVPLDAIIKLMAARSGVGRKDDRTC
jgi:hypothetical protein